MIIDNFKVDPLKLMSGAPIRLENLGLTIYQPKLYEIALIGEEKFYEALQVFRITKSIILSSIKNTEDKEFFDGFEEYQIIKMFLDNEPDLQENMNLILNLIIKDISLLKFNPEFILLKLESGQQYIINNDSFLVIKDIISQIFVLQNSEPEFKPANKLAEDIANKLKKRREKLDSLNGKKDHTVLGDFISILMIGLGFLNIKEVLNLTIYQIFNLIKRFGLYNQHNTQVQALLQGAEDIELVDWLQKI